VSLTTRVSLLVMVPVSILVLLSPSLVLGLVSFQRRLLEPLSSRLSRLRSPRLVHVINECSPPQLSHRWIHLHGTWSHPFRVLKPIQLEFLFGATRRVADHGDDDEEGDDEVDDADDKCIARDNVCALTHA
jgi:hypothetical protein